MASIDDLASDYEELNRQQSNLAQAEKARGMAALATGECWACGETELPTSDSLHCGDPDCVARVETILRQRARGMR